MSDIGRVVWTDLTVGDAEGIRDFYAEVVGWEFHGEPIEDYEDFVMTPNGGVDAAAGICHARGTNAALPPVWLVYISVSNIEESASKCKTLGGRFIDGPRPMGEGMFCAIADPSGAVCALFQSG